MLLYKKSAITNPVPISFDAVLHGAHANGALCIKLYNGQAVCQSRRKKTSCIFHGRRSSLPSPDPCPKAPPQVPPPAHGPLLRAGLRLPGAPSVPQTFSLRPLPGPFAPAGKEKLPEGSFRELSMGVSENLLILPGGLPGRPAVFSARRERARRSGRTARARPCSLPATKRCPP